MKRWVRDELAAEAVAEQGARADRDGIEVARGRLHRVWWRKRSRFSMEP